MSADMDITAIITERGPTDTLSSGAVLADVWYGDLLICSVLLAPSAYGGRTLHPYTDNDDWIEVEDPGLFAAIDDIDDIVEAVREAAAT